MSGPRDRFILGVALLIIAAWTFAACYARSVVTDHAGRRDLIILGEP